MDQVDKTYRVLRLVLILIVLGLIFFALQRYEAYHQDQVLKDQKHVWYQSLSEQEQGYMDNVRMTIEDTDDHPWSLDGEKSLLNDGHKACAQLRTSGSADFVVNQIVSDTNGPRKWAESLVDAARAHLCTDVNLRLYENTHP